MLSVGNIGLIFSFGSMMAGVTRERARRIHNKHLRPVHQSVRELLSTVQGGSKRGTVKKYIYIKSTTVYVFSSELGLSQPLLSPAIVPSPPDQRVGGTHSPAGEGLGESQFRLLETTLSTLPTLSVPSKQKYYSAR